MVDNDNCSGCGACTLLAPGLVMGLDAQGFLRPHWRGDRPFAEHTAVTTFRAVCPGVEVRAPQSNAPHQEQTLGSFVSAWSGWAVDDAVRFSGSSGGVLTALAAWLLASGQVHSVLGAHSDPGNPVRTSVSIMRSRNEVVEGAGSRYAPVAVLESFSRDAGQAVIAKPCEAYAARRLLDQQPANQERPLLLSFFCAGVPSQNATLDLVDELGVRPETVTALRYRGNGWPGNFAVSGADASAAVSYEQSWGDHLGRRLQGRCRICPDGTGGHADITVGDYWATDDRGYPVFDTADGVSAVLARTERGHTALLDAQRAGAIELVPVSGASVAGVQPFQRLRRATLLGRLTGKRAAGQRVPHYRGYELIRNAVRSPKDNLTFLRGTRYRIRQQASASQPGPHR